VPWDIPVEDYLFGFSMITLTLLLWVRLGRPTDGTEGTDGTKGSDRTDRTTTQEAP
jgi:hypothetical protein